LYFLSEDETRFFEALCETIVPSGSDPATDPGALTVGATSYIDSCLYGLPPDSQQYFKDAIEALDKYCETKFSKKFAKLDSAQKDSAIKEFFLAPATRERMFDLRSLVLEGFYSDYHDPKYTGITAWEYVEFGGKRISDLKKDWSFLKIWKDYSKEK
jgi:Gluconate 2-dehydrogenase subunit 3